MKLLTLGNPKMEKGVKKGYLPAILHLAPYTLSGVNVCPKATAGCAAACLNTAGRGGMGLDANNLNTIQRARIRKTRAVMGRATRAAFMSALVVDIDALIRKADRDHLVPCVRLNGTSDLRWETFPVERDGTTYPNIMEAFPGLQFYDYTKIANRRIAHIPNYHLTFSRADGNALDVETAFDNDMSVAAVVRDPDNPGRRKLNLPATYWRRTVVDGDESDLRFLDPPGAWVLLRAKGRAVTDTSGFVLEMKGIAA